MTDEEETAALVRDAMVYGCIILRGGKRVPPEEFFVNPIVSVEFEPTPPPAAQSPPPSPGD